MARGGARNGAGRKPGSITKAARTIAEQGLDGITPLEYLLGVMRDETQDERRRDEAAKAAAPYVHARLASVEANITGKLTIGAMLDAIE